MWVLAILMFFSLLVAVVFLCAFIWAVKSGQYDDKYTPSVRILLEEEINRTGEDPEKERKEKNKNLS